MPEKSAISGLVELTRRFVDAPNRRDVEAAMSSFAPQADSNAARAAERLAEKGR